MFQGESLTFYTYARVDEGRGNRWAYTGLRNFFFCDEASAREALRELRGDIESDPDDTWAPMQLEKIETVPVSRESVLALLNDGIGAFVKRYEIIETLD
ncbi:hypothetical protein [Rhizobium leguminosarum]|uniref:Uncharacterized protein n=1 Tax=Rhizobium leguminosarum TaxID=384 RepID=A0A7K3VU27_RHILE|nr:hypothetical protein [Rhizobium leguminosarum]NEK20699.1 hypothetical protein [Rhizobium leguminosarum]